MSREWLTALRAHSDLIFPNDILTRRSISPREESPSTARSIASIVLRAPLPVLHCRRTSTGVAVPYSVRVRTSTVLSTMQSI